MAQVTPETEASQLAEASCHDTTKKRPDVLLWGSLGGVVVLYLLYWVGGSALETDFWLGRLASSVVDLVNTMWWGMALAIVMIGLLGKVPREFVMSVWGEGGGLRGILRATLGGLLLDLCNHGILMVGTKLYERGASGGQLIAFLVASPWNSFSLTLILIALIGLPMMLAFVVLSFVIAVISGLIYERLVAGGTLPANPNKIDIPAHFRFWPEAQKSLRSGTYDRPFFTSLVSEGVKDSRMVMRWMLFGILLASVVRVLLDTSTFETYFGPTLVGLGLTVLAATIIEVCSEGSAPLAADLVTRGGAPGNGFAFLMAGASTDYTEVMVLKDCTRSWKFALFLPLVTLPQVLLIGWLLNTA